MMKTEKHWYERWWIAALLSLTFVVIVASLFNENKENKVNVTITDPALDMMRDGTLLKIRTENAISELLKTPSVANFTTYVEDLQFGSGPAFKGKNKSGKEAPIISMYTRKVHGYVDSQNSFGAMMRIPFEMNFLLDKTQPDKNFPSVAGHPSIVVGTLSMEGKTYGYTWK